MVVSAISSTIASLAACFCSSLDGLHAVSSAIARKIERVRICGCYHEDHEAEFAALLAAAEEEPEWRLAILLAGSAGLRLGEIMALQWSDREQGIKKMTIHRSMYKGVLGATKGWNLRTIPLTKQLDAAFRECRHIRGKFVICNADGSAKKVTEMRAALPRLCRQAGIDYCSWHPLRHTFCSHLAMRGAPAKVIQELAGHSDLKTTLKYMHLASGAKEQAMALLDQPTPCIHGAYTE